MRDYIRRLINYLLEGTDLMGLLEDINGALDEESTTLEALQASSVQLVTDLEAYIAAGSTDQAALQNILTRVQAQSAGWALVKQAVDQANADVPDAPVPTP